MTRARDMANLGSQAGSGLDASDITTGVLPVGVTGGSGLDAVPTSTGALIKTTIYQYNTGSTSAQHNHSTDIIAMTGAITVACTSGNTYQIIFTGRVFLANQSSSSTQDYVANLYLYEPASAISVNEVVGNLGSQRYYYVDGSTRGGAGTAGNYYFEATLHWAFTAGSTGDQFFVFAASAGDTPIRVTLNSPSNQESDYKYIVNEFKGDNLTTN